MRSGLWLNHSDRTPAPAAARTTTAGHRVHRAGEMIHAEIVPKVRARVKARIHLARIKILQFICNHRVLFNKKTKYCPKAKEKALRKKFHLFRIFFTVEREARS
jgi:hypothetical protein